MGNRVFIKFVSAKGIKLAKDRESAACVVYQHWNGGIESTHAMFNAVRDFMEENHRKGDLSYFQARYIQCVGHYIGGVTSLGLFSRLTKDDGFNDNPDITYDINEAADPKDIENPHYLKKFIAGWKTEAVEKYHTIYAECLQYLRSTKSDYEATGADIEAMKAEAKKLLDKAKKAEDRTSGRKFA